MGPLGRPVHDILHIDGAYGEGGGQILRTAVSLAAVKGQPIRIENIRARRRNPGLAAQHLTAVRAVGAICEAEIDGDTLGSTELSFAPGGPVRPGIYVFDVAEAREGGSAGSTSLVLQALLLPLALADGPSSAVVRGGTHVRWSPSFHYARDVWLPALGRLGVAAELSLARWGWYPVGQGEIRAEITGRAGPLSAIDIRAPGRLRRVAGRAVAANLPAHIAQRMADRARTMLAAEDIESQIRPRRVRAACAGAGLFLVAEYEHIHAGFTALGERGKPAERVAEEAVAELLDHHRSHAAVDPHLGDQLIVPAAFAAGESRFTVAAATGHMTTMAWLVDRFGLAHVEIDETTVRIRPNA